MQFTLAESSLMVHSAARWQLQMHLSLVLRLPWQRLSCTACDYPAVSLAAGKEGGREGAPAPAAASVVPVHQHQHAKLLPLPYLSTFTCIPSSSPLSLCLSLRVLRHKLVNYRCAANRILNLPLALLPTSYLPTSIGLSCSLSRLRLLIDLKA